MALTFPGNRISLFQVANFNAFTGCFIQLDDETAKMAECYICCLTPPTDKGKMKAFPSSSKMPKMSCGKGDDIRMYVRHAFLFVAIYFHTHTHKYPDVNI
jgi:hypothetical protein